MTVSRRIVLSTFGSLGDLHPFLAVARALRARGHDAVVATHPDYRDAVTAAGAGFAPVRPHVGPMMADDPALAARVMHPRHGPEAVVRRLVLPHVADTHEDTRAAIAGADVVVAHGLVFPAPILAGARDIPWVAVALQPMIFFSAHDPPIPSMAPWLEVLRRLPPAASRAFWRLGRLQTRGWFRGVDALREREGQPDRGHPMFEGMWSPTLNLAMFSARFGPPQPDWPPHTVVTGFCFLDRPGAPLPPALAEFLDGGPEPLVFALGSAAVHAAGRFWDEAIALAGSLGRRAVLVTGRETGRHETLRLPAGAIAVEYAPYASLFPRAAAVIHQGGVGTTGEAMRSGRPMLVAPFAHDQYDNAARIERLGSGLRLPHERFTAARARPLLERLLADPAFAARAAETAAEMRGESGAETAAAAIEGVAGRRA